jgi:hypothetical protein
MAAKGAVQGAISGAKEIGLDVVEATSAAASGSEMQQMLSLIDIQSEDLNSS